MNADLRIGLAIIILPIVVWGVLVVSAGLKAANLRPILRWIRAFQWVLAVVAASIVFYELISTTMRGYPILWSIICASYGFGKIEGWLKRNYFPELMPSQEPDEWWPSENK